MCEFSKKLKEPAIIFFIHTKTLAYFDKLEESNFSGLGASAISKELGIGRTSVYRALD